MVRIIKWTYLAVRFMTPWLIRVGVFVIWNMITTMTAWWVGIPNAVRSIAIEWQRRALANGLPSLYDRSFYFAACVVATGMILLGWLAWAWFTMWLVRLIL